jgi:hypothetical protein
MRVEDSTQKTAGILWSEDDCLHIVGLIGDLELFLGDIRRWCVFLDILEDLACFCWVFSYRGGPFESSLTKDWLTRSKDAAIVIVCIVVWGNKGGMGQIYIAALYQQEQCQSDFYKSNTTLYLSRRTWHTLRKPIIIIYSLTSASSIKIMVVTSYVSSASAKPMLKRMATKDIW